MASVEKRGKRWRIRFLDRHGRYKWKTTRAATKSEAQRLADDKERAEERIREGVEKPRRPDIRFADAVPLYLASLPPDYQSRDSLEGRLRNRIVPYLGTKWCREITPADVKALLAGRRTPPSEERDMKPNAEMSPATREQLRVAVSAVFSYLIEDEKHWDGIGPAENPAGKVAKVKGPKRVPKPLDVSEIPRVMEKVSEQHRMLFLWSVATGTRKGEAFAVLKADVRLEQRKAFINGSHDRDTTKGGEGRIIGLPAWFIPRLRDHMEKTPGAYVFPWKDGERRPRWQALHRIIKTAMRRADVVTGYRARCVTRGKRKGCGFEEVREARGDWTCACGKRLVITGIPKPITFHNLRTTFATWALAQGGDSRHVQDQLGHKDARTTRVYTKVLADHLADMTDRMDLGLGTTVGQAQGHSRTLRDIAGHRVVPQLPAMTSEESP